MGLIGVLPAILAVSILSGTMGIGVAFAAIPVLSLHGGDLVHAIQPVALCLNGVTAFFAAISFGRAGYINARKSVPLAATMTVFSPLGAYAAQWVKPDLLWILYFVAVALVVYLLCGPRPAAASPIGSRTVLAWSAPIAVFSSMLGVGPGFLVVPLLILAGASPRSAAGTSAFAVVPASFAALVPHLASATPDIAFALPVVGMSAIGAWVGGYFASRSIPEHILRNLFVSLILALALYKAFGLAYSRFSPQSDAVACELQSTPAAGLGALGCRPPR